MTTTSVGGGLSIPNTTVTVTPTGPQQQQQPPLQIPISVAASLMASVKSNNGEAGIAKSSDVPSAVTVSLTSSSAAAPPVEDREEVVSLPPAVIVTPSPLVNAMKMTSEAAASEVTAKVEVTPIMASEETAGPTAPKRAKLG